MCMLCVIPPNVIPDKEKLINSALNNPHGYGFAIAIPEENRILVKKTMNADESIKDFIEMRTLYPEGYAIWHARFATHGDLTVDNCHPFKVDDAGKTWLAHNGILDVLEDNSGRSDTLIFAEDILPKMGGIHALDNDQLFNMVEDFTKGSKLAILSIDPAAKYQCYIIHEKDGWKDTDGVWWSNYTCELGGSASKYYYDGSFDWGVDSYDYTGTYKHPTNKDDENLIKCELCESYSDEDVVDRLYNGYCPMCEGCFECNSDADACQCWTGKRARTKQDDQSWDEYYEEAELQWAKYDREQEEKGRQIALKAIERQAMTILGQPVLDIPIVESERVSVPSPAWGGHQY